ncbi:MAG: UvrB/UvrC motif-containing protein [Candidatus Pacebacteria bacterium]|nr:UvrB/UvrC motif-containing protein [Candidatus Paceibacterota bacterium]
MEKFKFLPKNKLSQLPKVSGVYALKKGAKLLYIGKAANIKERVKQHKELLSLAKQLGYIKTDSEIEALILEANLIKKYKPKYNVIWRDDKNYFFVGITKEEFPIVFITHQTKLKTKNYKLQTKYIGPFVDGGALKQTLKILRKIFPYRSCKNLPKHPCLWYQLLRCPAPCLLKNQIECQQNAKNLIKILQGKKNQEIIDLKREMKMAAKSQNFEKATKIRDQIQAFEKVISHARIFEPVETRFQQEKNWGRTKQELKNLLKTKKEILRIEAYDVSNIQGKQATGSMVVFINDQPDKSQYRKFKIRITGKPNDIAMLKEVLNRRFNHPEWGWPDLILIDGGKAQLNAALQCSINLKFISQIKVVALAKKKNELFIEGKKKPVLLKNLPRAIFNLILQLRDEAHRFAISYHHKLREIDLRESLC